MVKWQMQMASTAQVIKCMCLPIQHVMNAGIKCILLVGFLSLSLALRKGSNQPIDSSNSVYYAVLQ